MVLIKCKFSSVKLVNTFTLKIMLSLVNIRNKTEGRDYGSAQAYLSSYASVFIISWPAVKIIRCFFFKFPSMRFSKFGGFVTKLSR